MLRLLTALMAVILFSRAAHATLVRVDLSGHIYALNGAVSPFVRGDPVSGTFVYDTAISPDFSDGTYTYYPGAVISGNFHARNLTVIFGQGARIIQSNDELAYGTLHIDRFMMDQYGTGPSLNGLDFSDIFFNWQDNSGHASDGGLPKSQIDFDRYGPVTGAIDWFNNQASNRITFVMSAKVALVPEPQGWVTMLIGFGFIGCLIRFRGRGYAASA